MSDWRYYSCDYVTGRLNSRLPLIPNGAITRELTGIGTGTFSLPLNDPACPDNWQEFTIPMRHIIVAEMNGKIVWAGPIGARKRDNSDMIDLNCSSVESFFERRYVDWSLGPFVSTDQHLIMLSLVEHAMHTAGLPIVLDDFGASGVKRDRTEYFRFKDQRIFDMMDDLANVSGGPEWTLLTRWAEDPDYRRVEHVFVLNTPYVGNVTDTPEWVFQAPGNITEWEIFEDFSDEHYATTVVAGGEGEGSSRLMSTVSVAQDSTALSFGAPFIEHRYSTQLTTQDSVDAAAVGMLEQIKRGTVTAKIKLRADEYPLDTGWALGDTCRLKLKGGGYPGGYDKLWRIVGWNVDPLSETIEPILNPWGEQEYA